MPAEIRHIVFCSSEIAAAVREYRKQVHRPLPSGALRRLDMSCAATGGVRLAIEIAPDSGGSPQTAELGNAELADALSGHAANWFDSTEPSLVTRARHRQALGETVDALDRALAVAAGRDEVVAEELRLAARALGRLTGRVDVDDILDVIFRDFCIGK